MSIKTRRTDWSDFYWDMGHFAQMGVMHEDWLTRRWRRAAEKASRDGVRMRGRGTANEARLLRAMRDLGQVMARGKEVWRR